MDPLLVAGGGLAAVAVAALARRRGRGKSLRNSGAGRRGWTRVPRGDEQLFSRLRDLALFQVGHSRRSEGVFQTSTGALVFHYYCETGFEHRRAVHRWWVVARPVDHGLSRAIITSQDWLEATARLPPMRVLRLDAAHSGITGTRSHIAVAEDEEEWRALLAGEPGEWFAHQPMERTWEVVRGVIAAYEDVPFSDEAVERLISAAEELARLLDA